MNRLKFKEDFFSLRDMFIEQFSFKKLQCVVNFFFLKSNQSKQIQENDASVNYRRGFEIVFVWKTSK